VVILEEVARFDQLEASILAEILKNGLVPVIPEVAEAGGEHDIAVVFTGHEHLLEKFFVHVVVVDQSGCRHKVILPAEMGWERIVELRLAKQYFFELFVDASVFGFGKHVRGGIDAVNFPEANFVEGLAH